MSIYFNHDSSLYLVCINFLKDCHMPPCGWCVPDPHIVGPFGELPTFRLFT